MNIGEAVAWIKPDWQNNYDGMSPVTVYERRDWIPLYTHPAPTVDAAPSECRHEGWSFKANGRGCPKCGAIVMDFGD